MHASTAYTGRTLRQLDEDNQNAYYPVKIITDVVTRFLGNPFYVLKVRLQSRDISRKATFVSEAKQLWKEGQMLALFRGGMPALARYTLYSGLQTFFKNTRNTRLARSVGHNVWVIWLGNLVPLVLSYPLNTLQTRMSLHVSNYARYADIWREIKHGRTGLVQGLFAGVGVGVVGTLVYQLVIGLAEKGVDQAIAYLEKNDYIAPVPRRGISVPSVVRICVASVVAHFAAYPFDIVCARLQSGEFATVYGCVAMTLEEEGIAGFYKGVWPELFKALPMTLLMGGTYYVVGRWFRTHSKKERRDTYVNFFSYIWEDLVGALFNRL